MEDIWQKANADLLAASKKDYTLDGLNMLVKEALSAPLNQMIGKPLTPSAISNLQATVRDSIRSMFPFQADSLLISVLPSADGSKVDINIGWDTMPPAYMSAQVNIYNTEPTPNLDLGTNDPAAIAQWVYDNLEDDQRDTLMPILASRRMLAEGKVRLCNEWQVPGVIANKDWIQESLIFVLAPTWNLKQSIEWSLIETFGQARVRQPTSTVVRIDGLQIHFISRTGQLRGFSPDEVILIDTSRPPVVLETLRFSFTEEQLAFAEIDPFEERAA